MFRVAQPFPQEESMKKLIALALALLVSTLSVLANSLGATAQSSASVLGIPRGSPTLVTNRITSLNDEHRIALTQPFRLTSERTFILRFEAAKIRAPDRFTVISFPTRNLNKTVAITFGHTNITRASGPHL